MRYGWGNQNQTYRQEIGGHYLWSPTQRQQSKIEAAVSSSRSEGRSAKGKV
jgi:hypothetical protein